MAVGAKDRAANRCGQVFRVEAGKRAVVLGFPAVEPILWHCRHPASVFPSMDPVRQLGAVTPPWQLTLAQVRAALSNAAGPALAL